MSDKEGKKIFNVALPLLIILTLTLSFKEALALKKEYPTKAITMIVGTQPGGLSDLGARVCSDGLSKRLGVPIVIVNKPGAGGNAALAAASNAKPDGYTIVTATSAAVIQQVLFPNVPYHITKDFIPICTYASVPKLLVVNSNSPFKTIQELLDYAKKNPGKLNCASPGRGTGSHFEMEQFKAQEKVDIIHVPFKSSTEAISALLGNHVDLIFATLTPVHGMLKAGRLRGLAITMKDKEFLDMPMFSHKSIPGWEGFLAPVKIPKPVHKLLVETFEKTLKDPDMIPKMPPEFFMLMIMSMTFVTYLSRGSMIKALMMASLGLFLSAVGFDSVTCKLRFDYGFQTLRDGLGVVPMVMGLFGISEVLYNIGLGTREFIIDGKIKGLLPTWKDIKVSLLPITRGSLLGFFMGIIPGLGAIIPTFISYGLEKRISRHPEKFGTGAIEGVAAPESCNNAASVATFVPMLSLGIPANAIMALLLGALMIQGIQPGPLLIKEQPEIFWGLIASMYIGNAMLLVLNLPLIPLWVRLLRVPYTYLGQLILVFCLIGSYTLNNDLGDVTIMVIFGGVGLLMKHFNYETAPLILAVVLGPMLEDNLRQSLILSRGSYAIFIFRPISAVLLAATLFIFAVSLFRLRPVEKLRSEEG